MIGLLLLFLSVYYFTTNKDRTKQLVTQQLHSGLAQYNAHFLRHMQIGAKKISTMQIS